MGTFLFCIALSDSRVTTTDCAGCAAAPCSCPSNVVPIAYDARQPPALPSPLIQIERLGRQDVGDPPAVPGVFQDVSKSSDSRSYHCPTLSAMSTRFRLGRAVARHTARARTAASCPRRRAPCSLPLARHHPCSGGNAVPLLVIEAVPVG